MRRKNTGEAAMTDRELIQQWMQPGAIVPVDMNTVRILLDALRLAIEQAERQEPVAYRVWDRMGGISFRHKKPDDMEYVEWDALYTAPPQQEKQEPTAAMIQALTEQYDADRAIGIGFNPQTLCRAVIAAAKEMK
jgi:hypothetical protein